MIMQYECFAESSVCRYHEYYKTATVCIGSILFCEVEPGNDHDKFAVGIFSEHSATCQKKHRNYFIDFFNIMEIWKPSALELGTMLGQEKGLSCHWIINLLELLNT